MFLPKYDRRVRISSYLCTPYVQYIKTTGIIGKFNSQTYDVTLAGRTLYKDGAWNTLCLPFDVTIAGSSIDDDGVQAMTLDSESSGLSGTTLTLNFTAVPTTGEQAGLIPAGTPFIIKWDNTKVPESPDLKNPTFTSITIDNSAQAQARKTVNFTGGSFVGTYDPIDLYSPTKGNLYLGANNSLYYPWGDGMTSFPLNAFRAYFSIDGASEVREFKLNFFDEQSGDDSETQGIQPIFNPQSSIFNEASWFTLDGRKLDGKPTKNGLYINNGRKVLVK